MPDYRTPLPGLFATALENAINRVLALDEASADRIDRLEGKVLQLDLEGVGITLFLSFGADGVKIGLDSEDEPDTLISGSPLGLFQMAGPEEVSRWGLPGSTVHISGDAALARDIERLFSRLEPDWEGNLSGILGDVLGYQVSQGLRQGLTALREAARSTGEMVTNYVRDESELLVRRAELDTFREAVDDLKQELESIESQLDELPDPDS